MERIMDQNELKKILGINFIGLQEIELIHKHLNISSPFDLKQEIPQIPFSLDLINKHKDTHVLFFRNPFSY